MNKSLASPSNQVHWPGETFGYGRSIRATVYRTTMVVTFAIANVPILLMKGIFELLDIKVGTSHWWAGNVVIVASCYAGWWLYIRGIYAGIYRFTGFRFAKTSNGFWWSAWNKRETQSAQFKEFIREHPDILARQGGLDDILERVPLNLGFNWSPEQYQDLALPKFDMPAADDAAADSQKRLLTFMAIRLAQLEGNSVIMRFDGDAPAILAIFMPTPWVQLWTIFSVNRVGRAISCRLQTGHQWWHDHAVFAVDGTYIPSDRTNVIWGLVKSHARILIWSLLGPVFVAILLYLLARELVLRDHSKQILMKCRPEFGQASDLHLVMTLRPTWPKFGTPTSNVMTRIETLKAYAMKAASDAISLSVAPRADASVGSAGGLKWESIGRVKEFGSLLLESDWHFRLGPIAGDSECNFEGVRVDDLELRKKPGKECPLIVRQNDVSVSFKYFNGNWLMYRGDAEAA